MPVMAKRKPKNAARDRDRHVSPKLQLHIPQDLRDTLERYLNDTKPETTISAVVRLALEQFLASKGYVEDQK